MREGVEGWRYVMQSRPKSVAVGDLPFPPPPHLHVPPLKDGGEDGAQTKASQLVQSIQQLQRRQRNGGGWDEGGKRLSEMQSIAIARAGHNLTCSTVRAKAEGVCTCTYLVKVCIVSFLE